MLTLHLKHRRRRRRAPLRVLSPTYGILIVAKGRPEEGSLQPWLSWYGREVHHHLLVSVHSGDLFIPLPNASNKG